MSGLPDFENYQYRHAIEPPECKLLNAWTEFRETERRLEMYKWAESLNDPVRPLYRTFLGDCVSAFLLTFEATLQFVKDSDAHWKGEFDCWIKKQPDNDVTVKGLRTLRILIAHVESKPILSAITAIPPAGFTRKWGLHQLSMQDLEGRVRPKLEGETDFQIWNDLVLKKSIADLFDDGLSKLRGILLAAEQDSLIANKRLEEKLSIGCFVEYLRQKNLYPYVNEIPVQGEYPDYWLDIPGKRFDVQVTSLAKDADFLPRGKHLAEHIESEAKSKGWLCGSYLLRSVGDLKIPDMSDKDWRRIVDSALDYVQRTAKSGEECLIRNSTGVLTIEKISTGKPFVEYTPASGKWEGIIRQELKELIQERINKKRVPQNPEQILLLYDAYLFADLDDVRSVMKDISGCDWYHAIFWVQASKTENSFDTKGYILHTKETSWV